MLKSNFYAFLLSSWFSNAYWLKENVFIIEISAAGSNLKSGKVVSWNAASNYVKLQVGTGGFSGKPLVVTKPWMKRQVKFRSLPAIMASLMNDSCFGVNYVDLTLFSVFLFPLINYQSQYFEMCNYWRNWGGEVFDWEGCCKFLRLINSRLPSVPFPFSTWELLAKLDFIFFQKGRMEKTIDTLRSNFMSIRTGRANPAMLDKIEVPSNVCRMFVFEHFPLLYLLLQSYRMLYMPQPKTCKIDFYSYRDIAVEFTTGYSTVLKLYTIDSLSNISNQKYKVMSAAFLILTPFYEPPSSKFWAETS